MGKAAYQEHMQQKLQDFSFRIEDIKSKLADGVDNHARMELRSELERLATRRDLVRDKLEALEYEPDGTWADVKADFEQEWDDLMQDFEERIARLP